MQALRELGGGVVSLALHVQPGAKKTGFAGLHGDALKIRLAAPPVDGKANACLLAFVADYLDLPRRAVSLMAGEASRQKVLRIDGLDAARRERLSQVLAG